MKLTNISLAVLVALGLVACGGSDDNNNQTTDPKPPKEIPGDGGNGGNGGDGGTPPKGDKSALVPSRQAPDLTVAPDAKNIVDSRKRVFIDRGFSDSALGYKADGVTYQKNQGTDPADVKLTSTYNFSAEDDVVTDNIVSKTFDASLGAPATEYTSKSVGAILVGDYATMKDATKGSNAFVKISGDKYGRVYADMSGELEYTPDTKFKFITTVNDNPLVDTAGKKDKAFSQSEVIFIANAPNAGTKDIIELGTSDDFDVTKGNVLLDNVDVFGEEYSADSTGKNLNFGKLKPMREIQTADITGHYSIINNKDTSPNVDDKRITNSITLGKIKAYNLPYSIALVTTNADDKKPKEKNVFNLPTGAFQVRGYETPSLPREGRAHYYGKSFNASVVGDVELIADFAADRTGISGTVFNRKDHTGKDLPTLSLEKIQLTDPENHKTTKTGNVTGQSAYVDTWSVTIFGPEAEEAAGTLSKSKVVKAATRDAAAVIEYDTKEVYNTQRKELTNVSNNDSVK